MKGLCERCFKKTNTTTMSIFNTQMICLECKENEKNHPDYNVAKQTEFDLTAQGILDYKGYGLPIDREINELKNYKEETVWRLTKDDILGELDNKEVPSSIMDSLREKSENEIIRLLRNYIDGAFSDWSESVGCAIDCLFDAMEEEVK